MKTSESIANLATALAAFQAEVKNPPNTADNPFFKSKYAPLSDILNLVRPLLAKHGLSVIQMPSGENGSIQVHQALLHSSGEWITTPPVVAKADKDTAQGAGSAITYLRRYGLSALVGISSEDDDDGNQVSKTEDKPAAKPAPKPKAKPADPQRAMAAVWATAKECGLSEDEVHVLAFKAFKGTTSLKSLSADQLKALATRLKQADPDSLKAVIEANAEAWAQAKAQEGAA